jgi:hypothetical protein
MPAGAPVHGARRRVLAGRRGDAHPAQCRPAPRPGTPSRSRWRARRPGRDRIDNEGPAIPDALLERIFDYGVSDATPAEGAQRRGQGLFVARTYMAKMGGPSARR